MKAENAEKLEEIIAEEGLGLVLKYLGTYASTYITIMEHENRELNATIKAADKLNNKGLRKAVKTILGDVIYTQEKKEKKRETCNKELLEFLDQFCEDLQEEERMLFLEGEE